jgi:hypothetical protein
MGGVFHGREKIYVFPGGRDRPARRRDQLRDNPHGPRGHRSAGTGGPGDPVCLGADDHVAAVMVGQDGGDGRVHGHCHLLSGGTGPGSSRWSPSRLVGTPPRRQGHDYPFREPVAERVQLPRGLAPCGGNAAGSGRVVRQCAAVAGRPPSRALADALNAAGLSRIGAAGRR